MAARHFALARASRPESREALEGWWQASSLITTQIQDHGQRLRGCRRVSAKFPVERVLAISHLLGCVSAAAMAISIITAASRLSGGTRMARICTAMSCPSFSSSARPPGFTWKRAGLSMTMAAGGSRPRPGPPSIGKPPGHRALPGLQLLRYHRVLRPLPRALGPVFRRFRRLRPLSLQHRQSHRPLVPKFLRRQRLQYSGRDPKANGPRYHSLDVSGPGGEDYFGGFRRL